MLIALFLIVLLTFAIMHAVPGGPFTSDRQVSEEVLQALNENIIWINQPGTVF